MKRVQTSQCRLNLSSVEVLKKGEWVKLKKDDYQYDGKSISFNKNKIT